jgi:hypothetical protein
MLVNNNPLVLDQLIQPIPAGVCSQMPQPTVKTIALDWIEVNFKAKMISQGNDMLPFFIYKEQRGKLDFSYDFIEEEVSHNRVYSKRHTIFAHGREIATVYSVPYSNAIKPPESVTIKLANHLCYSGWFETLRHLATIMNLKLDQVKRLDVACDGYNFTDPVNLVKMERINLVGNSEIDFKVRGGKGVHSFLLGSRKSDRYLRCYNKNQEIEQHSKKYYIKDFWKHNKVDPKTFSKMERLEVVMKAKEIRRCLGEMTWTKLKELETDKKLISIAKTEFRRLYEFREKKNVSNVSRLKAVFEIKWHAFAFFIPKLITKTAKRIRALQTTIKTTYQLFLKTNQPYFESIANDIIHNTGLQDWFEKKRGYYEQEFERTVKHDREFLPLYGDTINMFLPQFNQVTRRSYIGAKN